MRIHLEMEVKIKVLRIPSSEVKFGQPFYGQDFQPVPHVDSVAFLEREIGFSLSIVSVRRETPDLPSLKGVKDPCRKVFQLRDVLSVHNVFRNNLICEYHQNSLRVFTYRKVLMWRF